MTTATRTYEEIGAALDIERAYIDSIGFNGGALPDGFRDEIIKRAGFYPDNADRGRYEREKFRRETPSPYFAYHHEDGQPYPPRAMGRSITVWTGQEIATVIERGISYRSNFGDLRQSFRAIGINGAVYAGVAYLDAGQYVRMRKVKGTARELTRAVAYAESCA